MQQHASSRLMLSRENHPIDDKVHCDIILLRYDGYEKQIEGSENGSRSRKVQPGVEEIRDKLDG